MIKRRKTTPTVDESTRPLTDRERAFALALADLVVADLFDSCVGNDLEEEVRCERQR